jgi:hypothetical protein
MLSRLQAAEREGRLLAGRLAANAIEIANTFDRIANFHEKVSRIDGHPLGGHAAALAVGERRIASIEREQAVHLDRIARGGKRATAPDESNA